MCVGTGVPPYPWANTTARSETCYPATSCASSKVPMVGKNCGWFSPILVSFSSKPSRMTFLWPVCPFWAIRSGIRIRPMASVKTMFSSWYSRITFTTLELRVNTPSKGIKLLLMVSDIYHRVKSLMHLQCLSSHSVGFYHKSRHFCSTFHDKID